MTDLYTKALLTIIALCLAALVADAYWLNKSGRLVVSGMPRDTCGSTEGDACWVRSHERRPLPVRNYPF